MTTELIRTKICSKCREEKPVKLFRKQSASKDGFQSWCKVCHGAYNSAYNRPYYVANSDLWKVYEKRKIEAIKSDPVALTIHREKAAARVRKLRVRSPHLQKAHNAITHAIASGKLTRPNSCSKCGCHCKPEAHHDSYNQSDLLKVRWLCKRCHEDHHHKKQDAV
jgi:hypothetical protein